MVADADPFGRRQDGGEWRIAFADRTVGIVTGEAGATLCSEPRRADNMLTHGLSVPLDEHATCPRFSAELLPQLEDDDRRLMEFTIGQILLQHNVTQTLLIIEGPGNDGKSTLANLLEMIGGKGNYAALRTKHLRRTPTHRADGGGAVEFHVDGSPHVDSPFGEWPRLGAGRGG